MKLELDDELMAKTGADRQEALELLAIALYKYKGIHGSLAGKLIGQSEFEFHNLLSQKGENVNYDTDDLIEDLKDDD